MNLSHGVLAVSLSIAAVAGCTSKVCSLEYRYHSIEVTREVVTSDAVDALLVEACFGATCKSATPAAGGEVSFGAALGEQGPTTGSIVAATDPAKKRITVTYAVGESSSEPLVLRVKRGDTTLLDDRTTVAWSDDECHPAPKSTKL